MAYTAQQAALQSAVQGIKNLEEDIFDRIREASEKGEWEIIVPKVLLSLNDGWTLKYLGYEMVHVSHRDEYIIRWSHMKDNPGIKAP